MKIASSNVPRVVLSLLIAAAIASLEPVHTQEPTTVGPIHFHHLHLNSVNPSAAVEFYTNAFSSLTKASLAGFEGFKTGNIYVLFTKVNTAPPTEPPSAIWHFGWQTPDSRQYLERFRAMKLRAVPMYSSEDGSTIEITSEYVSRVSHKAADRRSEGQRDDADPRRRL